ncbi:MAG: class I SAM-dependent methyltransferase [Candidatus Omnitrophica bacterium]|nr:class I SAM-dependent methyltransferase [Candidatus Omnitrophota bacterium]
MTSGAAKDFYHKYYRTEKGAMWAKGHMGFANPLLNCLSEIRDLISIVGKRQRFFKKVLKNNKKGLILDLGCGGGYKLFTRYGAVIGVDLEIAPLKNACAACAYKMAVNADITSLPFEKDSFDYVVSSDVMGHIPLDKKNLLLSEIFRVLKPGGATAHAVETASANFLYRFAQEYPQLFQKSFVEEIGGHFGLEMPQAVLDRFAKKGFRPIRVERLWGFIWPTEEYLYRFDNEYKDKSFLIRALVAVSKALNKNIVIHALVNVFLGAVNYFVESLTPLSHTQGLLLAYRKP